MKAINAKHYLMSAELSNSKLPDIYPYNLSIIKNLPKLTFHPKITFLVGENGAGKSTLLEAIAIGLGLNAEGGSKNFNFETTATHSDLYKYLTLTKGINQSKDSYFLRAETYYNLASEIEDLNQESPNAAYGKTSLHTQSHGESFLSLIQNRFKGNGLYILDEPEAALSPASQFKLLTILHKLIGQNSQFIIATHSPILLGYPDADIYLLQENSLKKVAYEDTPHYQLTKYFVNNRESILKELLK